MDISLRLDPSSGDIFQFYHISAVLPGSDAGSHPQDSLDYAEDNGHHSGRVSQCCGEYLHWAGLNISS